MPPAPSHRLDPTESRRHRWPTPAVQSAAQVRDIRCRSESRDGASDLFSKPAAEVSWQLNHSKNWDAQRWPNIGGKMDSKILCQDTLPRFLGQDCWRKIAGNRRSRSMEH